MDDLKVLSETDLFSTISQRDYSSRNEDKLKNSISNISIENLSYLMPINIKQMFKTQNSNAPWLVNIIRRKFHRSRKSKPKRALLQEINAYQLEKRSSRREFEEVLARLMSNDGTSGKWIIDEKEVIFPLSGQYNESRALSNENSSHVHHYQYDFQANLSSTSISIGQSRDNSSSKLSNRELITEDLLPLPSARSTKRAKSSSASASRSRRRPAKRKKTKSYQERLLSPEEVELREALRIIDLDNVGFFPPSEFRNVLKELDISSDDIEKIERCLPLDDDGHYSIDNLVKLFLDSN